MSVASTFEVRIPVTSCWWITSVVVLAISCYVGWKFLIVSREIGQLLAG